MAAQPTGRPPATFTGLTNKHAIKCESIDGTPVEEYLNALAEITGADNIKAASRVYGSVVVYFNFITWVETVCVKGLQVSGYTSYVEPLVKPATKMVISGVPPFIPNETIEYEMMRFGRLVSGIKTIPLGCKNDRLKHVQSFRRQAFVLLDNDLQGPTRTYVNGPT